jgi:putative tricarboxylic transport membrane protein
MIEIGARSNVKASTRGSAVITAASLIIALAAGSATAERAAAEPGGWAPTRPVAFVIMAGAGGGADRAVRNLAAMIEKSSAGKVTFEPRNLPGRSGGDALAHVARVRGADADHMLLFTLNSFYTAPLDHPDLKIEPLRFAPIARMAEDAFVLWVHADRRDIRTFDDFVKSARGAGERWTMAGTGRGSEDQLLTEFLNATFRLKMRYTSFAGGGQVAKELAEKRADSTVNNPSEQSEHFPAGRTKPLATFTPRRLSQYPRTPTLGEHGVAFQYHMQRSVVGSPNMGAAARAYWASLFRATFDGPDWQSYRKKNSLSGAFLTGDELVRYWQRESERHERWRMAIGTMRR